MKGFYPGQKEGGPLVFLRENKLPDFTTGEKEGKK
jgi:hypothetical protein